MAVQVHSIANAAVGCGNHKGLTILHVRNMAQEGLIQNGMHSVPVIFSPCCTAFDLGPGSHSVSFPICSHTSQTLC